MNDSSRCAGCSIKIIDRRCRKPDGKAPAGCPTQTRADLAQKALEAYKDPEIYRFARQASIQEGEGYGDRELGYACLRPVKPRILEIAEFARKMKYSKLGLVFCIGLRKEAKAVEKFFTAQGFDLASVVCKVGCVPKAQIGVAPDQQLDSSADETMCNPVLQAMVLNEEKTDFNILLGLCVGHDSLFFQFTTSPCTVLAVKDRLLGHNPLAAVYNLDSYYRALK